MKSWWKIIAVMILLSVAFWAGATARFWWPWPWPWFVKFHQPPPPEFCLEHKTCGAMRDCEEARLYLKECGARRLDRDGDGVPCEAICN